MIDTHCHLYFDEFNSDRSEVIDRARKARVTRLIQIGIDPESNRKALDLANQSDNIYAAIGLHPHIAMEANQSVYNSMRDLLGSSKKIVGVGEIGLDYAKSKAPKEKQIEVFETAAELGASKDMPLVIHSRQAYRDTIKVLYKIRNKYPNLKAVFHCFTYDKTGAEACVDMGFYLSFTGAITYPGSKALREAVKYVPMDRFFIETDSPYLAPQPKRGKRNEPSYLVYLAEEIARIKGVQVSDIEEISERNALIFFGI